MKLIEKSLTVNEALDVFNINSVPHKQELRLLYKKLALKFHPDRNTEDQEMMYYINDAYEVLINTPEGTIKNDYDGNFSYHKSKPSYSLKDILKEIDPKGMTYYLQKFTYPLECIEKVREGKDYIYYTIEIFNNKVSYFIEYDFDIDNEEVYFLVSTKMIIGKIKDTLHSELYKYPEGKGMFSDYDTLFPSDKIKRNIKHH
jgi:hypothetical protein